MAKNLIPQCKQCRRAGQKLFLKGERCYSQKCEIVKRNYPPGIHGVKGKKRQSEYGMQLQEKQNAKKEYGLLEKQFRLTFEKAKREQGQAGENLLKLLETRLDNAIYRLGIAANRNQARQIIGHGHIVVNDKKVNIPSFQLKSGDVIKIKPASKKSKLFSDLETKLKKTQIPGWLNFDVKESTAKILHRPNMDDIKTNINVQMIVEYYSK